MFSWKNGIYIKGPQPREMPAFSGSNPSGPKIKSPSDWIDDFDIFGLWQTIWISFFFFYN